jgi:hypothetical protein
MTTAAAFAFEIEDQLRSIGNLAHALLMISETLDGDDAQAVGRLSVQICDEIRKLEQARSAAYHGCKP